jgi:hypothetical protein
MRKATMSLHWHRLSAGAPPGLSTQSPLCAIALVLFVTVACGGSASAGTVFTQAGVTGEFIYTGDPRWSAEDPADYPITVYNNYWNQGATSSSASGSLGTAASSASVSLFANPGLHLSVFAGSASDESGYTQSNPMASAQWVDLIHVGEELTHPDFILLHVTVDAIVDLENGVYNEVGFGVSQTTGGLTDGLVVGSGFQSQVGIGVQPVVVTGDGVTTTGLSFFIGDESSGVTNLRAAAFDPLFQKYASAVSWDTTFLVYYDSSLGGYELNLFAGASAFSKRGGHASANLLNTIRLTDVTLANGDSIAGGVTFDSGFRLPTTSGPDGTVTPEPTSLALAGFAGLGMAAGAWRRRRQTKPQAA